MRQPHKFRVPEPVQPWPGAKYRFVVGLPCVLCYKIWSSIPGLCPVDASKSQHQLWPPDFPNVLWRPTYSQWKATAVDGYNTVLKPLLYEGKVPYRNRNTSRLEIVHTQWSQIGLNMFHTYAETKDQLQIIQQSLSNEYPAMMKL